MTPTDQPKTFAQSLAQSVPPPQPARAGQPDPGVEALKMVLRGQRDRNADDEANARIELVLTQAHVTRLEADAKKFIERISALEMELAALKGDAPAEIKSPQPPPSAAPRTH